MSERLSADEILVRLRARLDAASVKHVAILDAATYNSPDEPPAGLGLAREDVIDVIEALALVVEADRGILFEHLPRAEAAGVASDTIRLTNGMSAEAAFFDLTERFGCWVAVMTERQPIDEGEEGPTLGGELVRVGRFRVSSLGLPLEVSGSFEAMLGWSMERMADLGTLEMIHVDDRGAVLNAWGAMMTNPKGTGRTKARMLRADGAHQWVEMTFERRPDGPDDGAIEVEVVDIQAEMAAVDALRAREQLLHRLAEVLPVGVVQIDADQHVVYANAAMAGITGRDVALTFADQLQDVIADDRARTASAVDQVLRTGVDGDLEVTIEHKVTGERRVCGISLRALVEDNGAIPGAIICVIDVTDSASRRHELEVAATFDTLTGLYNRASCLAALEGALRRPLAPPLGCAVVFVDLDDFKDVNDEHGHLVGDELLVETAQRLHGATRNADVIGRYGGDEFLVVCPDGIDESAAQALAQRVFDRLCQPFVTDGRTLEPRASVGVAWCAENGLSVSDLVARADAAMYHAKRAGSQEAHLWSPQTGIGTGSSPGAPAGGPPAAD